MNIRIDVSNIVIDTERLILRAFTESDLQDFYNYASVPSVGEMAGWPHHESIEISKRILRSFIDEKEVFAVYHKTDQKVIGSLGLHKSWANDDAYKDLKVKEIGYVLSKAYWGQGLMPEAVSAVIKYGFNTLGLDAFTCSHFSENRQSRRVIEKCGFMFVKQSEFYAKQLQRSFEDMKYILLRKAQETSPLRSQTTTTTTMKTGGLSRNMNLKIKPLTSDLMPDYLDFFDNRAFSDNNPCGPCYCTGPNMDASTEQQMVCEFGNDVKGTIRRYAVKMLAEEKIHGYLAFDGAVSIGWCNAGDMDSYLINDFGFIPDFARQDKYGKTMSVVCFAIAPEYRGKGVAAALLERVCADAKAKGFTAAEGYAKVQKDRVYYDYNGPIRLYEKAGFVEVARHDGRVVMRKEL